MPPVHYSGGLNSSQNFMNNVSNYPNPSVNNAMNISYQSGPGSELVPQRPN